MDRSVVTASLTDPEAAFAILEWMEHGGLDPAFVAAAGGTTLRDDRPVTAAIVLDPGHPPVLIEGFCVQATLALFEDAPDTASETSGPLEAALRRIAIPHRSALAYVEAVDEGTVLVAIRTPDDEGERTCRSLEAAGACATSIHIHHCFSKKCFSKKSAERNLIS